MTRYLKYVFGIALGIVILLLMPVIEQGEELCGSQNVSEGMECVDESGNAETYAEVVDGNRQFNVFMDIGQGGCGLAFIVGSVVGWARASHSRANAPAMQRQWPIPANLGTSKLKLRPVSGEQLEVFDNGFAYTEDSGLVKAATWADVVNAEVTIDRGMTSLKVWLAGRDRHIGIIYTAAALSGFTNRVAKAAVEHHFTGVTTELSQGRSVALDDKRRLIIDQNGLIREDGQWLAFNQVTSVDDKANRLRVFGPDAAQPWVDVKVNPRSMFTAAGVAVVRALSKR